MNNEQRLVRDWHHKFGVSVRNSPVIPDEEIAYLRMHLIEEEAKEFREAAEVCDLIGVADALGDLLFVVYGSAVCYGIDLEPIFAEISRSNMSKGDPEVIKREDGKILKGDNWSPPDLEPLIALQQKLGLNAAIGKSAQKSKQ